MLANRTSRWSIGAALLCVVLLAVSWFLLISPRRADASAVRTQAVQADSQADALQVKLAELKAEFADLPKQKEKLKAIKLQLPPNADIPGFVRQLQSLAAESGVSLDSVTPSAPVVVAAGATTSTAAGPGTVVSIPMGLVVTGDYFEASLFIKSLQTKISRSYLLTGIGAAPAPESAVAVTAEPVVTSTAAPTTAETTAPAVAAAPINLDRVTLTLTGGLFVLMDDTTTLDDVAKDAAAAAKAAGKTPATATATAAPAAASTVAAN